MTGDAVRASSALLVDYSCAIRLATPLAILSAMREGARRGILIKGGKFLEALAGADTVVFDKKGTGDRHDGDERARQNEGNERGRQNLEQGDDAGAH